MSTTTWKIDPTHTTVEFGVKHMMFTTVRGHFAEVAGTLVVDEQQPDKSSARIEIAAASIGTNVAPRDEHLRSADFFDAANHPTLTFASKRVEGGALAEGKRFRVIGDLTIRGTTREVVLDATFEGQGKDPWGNTRVGFDATTEIDRSDFGLTWNQALEAGGVLVSNQIKIHLAVQAVREEALAGVA